MDRYVDDAKATEGANSGSGAPRGAWHVVPEFGSNPGNLDMHLFALDIERPGRPLVVVLHGCTQSVATYDRASGWSRLAAAYDFLVLMPAQKQENNIRTCFSWFEPGDTTRGGGEVASIRQMIECVVADHAIDTDRIFICGLSAGGAMTAAMLAVYPEVFAAGAIIAGLPYGCAANVGEAVEAMQTGRIKEARQWGDAVRDESPHAETWPAVAIWHGTADPVVKPINAGELVKQWTNLHGPGAEVPAENHIGATIQRVWHDSDGRACVTEYSVPGLGHGAPVDDAEPPAPFFLPAGLSSTRTIAADWGLLKASRRHPLAFLGALLKTS